MTAPFAISPSGLGRYFFHDCERFLRWRSTRNPRQNGVPDHGYDTGTLMSAVLDSGRVWEETLLRDHLGEQARIAPGNGSIADRIWGREETIEQLLQAQLGQYIYQPTLRAPDVLYQRWGLAPDLVRIPDNRPDLIEVAEQSGERVYRIIDIKRGAALRLHYRVQVYFYAMELDAIARELGLLGVVDLEQGAAWLGGAERPHTFDLALVASHVDDLLERVPEIFASPVDELHWHLSHRCEWCEYLLDCHADMREKDDPSRLVGITGYGKRFLRKRLQVANLDGLRAALARPDIDSILAECASLSGERPRLERRLRAYQADEPVTFGSLHPALPRGENLALFITVQTEPVADRTWLTGMLLSGKEETRTLLFGESGKAMPYILLAEQEADCARVRERFLHRLHAILTTVHRWNEQQSNWADQLSLQLYCYSSQEREHLEHLLLECLYEPALAEQAMTVLFHLQNADMLEASEHPEDLVCHPIIPLVSAAGRLLALNVDVAYTLPEALTKLGSQFELRRDNKLHYPFGHGVRADFLLDAWNGEPINLDTLRREAANRLYAYCAFLRAVRGFAGDLLVTWPPKHRLAAVMGISHPQLSRLAFLARYEALLAALAIRDTRAEAREMQAAKGKLIPIRHLGGGHFKVTTSGVSLDASDFTRWLVVRDTDLGMQAQVKFDDWSRRRQMWPGRPDPHLGIATITTIEHDTLGYAGGCWLDWVQPIEGDCPVGGEFLLLPRFMDFNSERLVKVLEGIEHETSLCVELMADPRAASNRPPLFTQEHALLEAVLPTLSLTGSQEAALRTIAHSRVTAVWGPPGTGKTHFLVALIQALTAVYTHLGRPFRVLVTAMTHAAIENLLRKLLNAPPSQFAPTPVVGKVGYWRGDDDQNVELIDKDALDHWMANQSCCVVGSTVWGLLRSGYQFDLVLIDEASQLKTPDACLAIERVMSEGRLVAAGDHAQLGPIVNGVYPDPPYGEPVLHRSVLDLLLERTSRPGVPLCQLLENWRMNETLTDASRAIYGPSFRCANDEIANRRLRLRARRQAFVGACCDPDYPLVIVAMDGIQAAQTNEPEADLVAELAIALREDMEGVEDDRNFWKDYLFIISPHHSQIGAIRRRLASNRDWAASPFVDTVDKMQGQEAEAVLVSYGVSDPEYAAMEAEFIYGRNRLNVAITRARCKSIVFLPQPLLDGSPELLNDETVAEGLAYMRDLVALARRCETPREFPLNENVTACVFRVGRAGNLNFGASNHRPAEAGAFDS